MHVGFHLDFFMGFLLQIGFLHFLANKFAIELNYAVMILIPLLALSLFTDPKVQLIALVLFVVSEIDRVEYRIPDSITKPALFLLPFLNSRNVGALTVTAFWLFTMYLLTQFFPSTIGRGDIKLIASLLLANSCLTSITGRDSLFFLIMLLFLASLFALPGALLARRKKLNYPFAPAISGAALLLFGLSGNGVL